MQTPGLPDLPLVFLPRWKRHYDPDRESLLSKAEVEARTHPEWQLVVIEVKSPKAAKSKGGGLSPEQAALGALCVGAGVPYLSGDLSYLIQWLVQFGYLKASQVPHYRLETTR